MKSRGNDDTIAAVATGAGGGIGIIRISGPDALPIASRIFQGRGGRSLQTSAPCLLVLGTACDPASGEPIDEVLAVHMPEGRSYSGEPTVEIQGHGGRVVLEAVLAATLRAGARLAEPGEFTKRAFLSGRLDLTQAEAVAELICAEDEQSRRAALGQLRGGVAGGVNRLRERLVDLVARTEAAIDFEEGEVPDDLPTSRQIESLAGDIRALAAATREPARISAGVGVAFAGRANSGKSSLFNYLLDFERSIVAPTPGTTRDYIEERSNLGGARVTLIDTAGIRATEDAVEAEGVRRSIQRITAAQIVVLVVDGSEPSHPEDGDLFAIASDRSPIVVISKCDLPRRIDPEVIRSRTAGVAAFTLSAATGEGLPDFIAALSARCRALAPSPAAGPALPNVRYIDALERAAGHLDAAAGHLLSGAWFLDRTAVAFRAALVALGEITGQTATDEILDRVFERFCIGK